MFLAIFLYLFPALLSECFSLRFSTINLQQLYLPERLWAPNQTDLSLDKQQETKKKTPPAPKSAHSLLACVCVCVWRCFTSDVLNQTNTSPGCFSEQRSCNWGVSSGWTSLESRCLERKELPTPSLLSSLDLPPQLAVLEVQDVFLVLMLIISSWWTCANGSPLPCGPQRAPC